MSIIMRADLEGSTIAVFRSPIMLVIVKGLVTLMRADLVVS